MAAQTPTDFGGFTRPQGTLDASTALLPYQGRLDQRLAAHLLRRAGFGGSPEEISRYAAMSPDAAVESLVRYPSTDSMPPPEDIFSPGPTLQAYVGRLRSMDAEDRRDFKKQLVGNERESVVSIQTWWLNRMLNTPAPLQEKMTFLYHGHFTTTVIQKGVSPKMMYAQNQLFRAYALGNLRELTRGVSKDPAMMRYLDNTLNDAAHPNENFARELLELFTMGEGHYTENDIRESARAWTGYTFNRREELLTFRPELHDYGVKTFLGQSGNFTGDDIVNIIFQQPQTARFFAGWLLNNFVYNDPEPALIDGVAAMLRRHDYELAPVMSALLRSNVFFSDRAYRALVKSPVEFVVGAHKTLGLTGLEPGTLKALKEMGQTLFYPPNVAGWPGGQNWLTSATIIQRQNFLARIVGSQTVAQSSWLHSLPMNARSTTQAMVQSILQGDAAPASVFQIEGFLGGSGTSALGALSGENYQERISGAAYLAMSTPAFQLG